MIQEIQDALQYAKQQTVEMLKILHADNERDYISAATRDVMKAAGIIVKTILPYHPEHNGIVEIVNFTLMNGVRASLNTEKLMIHTGHMSSRI